MEYLIPALLLFNLIGTGFLIWKNLNAPDLRELHEKLNHPLIKVDVPSNDIKAQLDEIKSTVDHLESISGRSRKKGWLEP